MSWYRASTWPAVFLEFIYRGSCSWRWDRDLLFEEKNIELLLSRQKLSYTVFRGKIYFSPSLRQQICKSRSDLYNCRRQASFGIAFWQLALVPLFPVAPTPRFKKISQSVSANSKVFKKLKHSFFFFIFQSGRNLAQPVSKFAGWDFFGFWYHMISWDIKILNVRLYHGNTAVHEAHWGQYGYDPEVNGDQPMMDLYSESELVNTWVQY